MSPGVDRRSDAISRRHHDLTNCARTHRDSLRALLAVHAIVKNNTSPALLQNAQFDATAALKSELDFLDEYDLTRGRTFDASKLVLPFHPATNHSNATKPYRSVTSSKPTSTSSGHDVDSKPWLTPSLRDGAAAAPSSRKSDTTKPDVSSDASKSPSAPPASIVPPLPEDRAVLDESALRVLDQKRAQIPAKTVHLPPEEVQEQRRREIAEERAKAAADASRAKSLRPSVPQLHAPADAPSSPSSTVGPLSAATPGPPEESPDTSPDSEKHENEDILPPEDLRPSPEEQRAKEQHDRIHAAQMAIARAQARGDVDTPDDQLKWEEQEAAAREAEEQSARDRLAGPEPGVTKGGVVTEALQEELDRARAAATAASTSVTTPQTEGTSGGRVKDAAAPAQSAGASALSHIDTKAQPPAKDAQPSLGSAVDEDTIVVTPRVRTSDAGELGGPTPGSKHARMSSDLSITKRSPLLKRSRDRRDTSAEPVSPRTVAQNQDLETVSPAQLMRSSPVVSRPRAPPRSSAPESHGQASTALERLAALKGAASNPDNDYLVPLFRIQAHDSPNNTFSKGLPDLIRMAPKSLSTEDHFTAMDERIDFRMLRRIYQLQNANKWSLRQMDKAKEPEPQITHQDHLMAEMKWMRKDFQSERKMKRSVCAWLAQRCAQYVAASPEEKQRLRVRTVKPEESLARSTDSLPELDTAGESASEDNQMPSTPAEDRSFPGTLVVPPELYSTVEELSRNGKLQKALEVLPTTGITQQNITKLKPPSSPIAAVSKFVHGKVLPAAEGPTRKRSRYTYEDESKMLESQPSLKRIRVEALREHETPACALFHPENKQIRDRLHTNNSFRPPSEFLMPNVSFYEHRLGSQWTWEDDQKLRKLAKDYTFNWSLIADELSLPGIYKSSYDRRTPWECFERWVELESLPTDMKRTVYFKTWFGRLETSAQAAERRYQAQLAHYQQQVQQNGATPREVQRRKPTPTRVEKRRTTRYLWVIDGCRKIAKKREQQLWKNAEAARASSQRKPQTEPNPQRQLLTPQEISRKRYQQDLAARAALEQRMQQAQQARLLAARQAAAAQVAQQAQQAQLQQGAHIQAHPAGQQQHAGAQAQQAQQNPQQQQQRPPSANMAAPQAHMQANGQQMNGMAGQHLQQQQGRPVAIAQNGRMVMTQINGKPVQMPMQQAQALIAAQQQANLQQQLAQAQARGVPFNPQQFQMANNMASPGAMTPQQLQQQQAMIAAYQQQQQQQQQQQANNSQAQGGAPNVNGQQQGPSASPNMPPPRQPQQHAQGQLSSGHIPQIMQIKNQLRASNPNIPEDQLTILATHQMQLKNQSQGNTNNQNQARQNAMNAAAGIGTPVQGYAQQQQNGYTANGSMQTAAANGSYPTGDNTNAQQQQAQPQQTPQSGQQQQQQQNLPTGVPIPATAAQQQAYAAKMRQWQMAQMRQSPNTAHARLAGSSPSMQHASPAMTPASPMQYAAGVNAAGAAAGRPPSRSATPQMQRLGSSGSAVGGVAVQQHPANAMPSPGSASAVPVAGAGAAGAGSPAGAQTPGSTAGSVAAASAGAPTPSGNVNAGVQSSPRNAPANVAR